MAWRPITENDITPSESAGCTVPSEGTLVFTLYQGGTDDPDSGSYYAYFPEINGGKARLRVTPVDAVVQPFVDPEPFAEFLAARVAGYETNDELFNTLYTDPDPITEPLVGWHFIDPLVTTVEYLDFHGANTGRVYNEQTATFFVEIWDDGGAPLPFRPATEDEINLIDGEVEFLGNGEFRFTDSGNSGVVTFQLSQLAGDTDVKARVEITGYHETLGSYALPGNFYSAPYMQDGSDSSPKYNLFWGEESGQLPDGDPPTTVVDAWVPSLGAMRYSNGTEFEVGCGSYTNDGVTPEDWSVTFKIEYVGGAPVGACFWTDKVGVFEDCGGGPAPNPQPPFYLADVVFDHPYLMGAYGLSFRSNVVDALGHNNDEEFYIVGLWRVEKDGAPMLGALGFSADVPGITEEDFAQATLTEVLQSFGATFRFDYNGGGVSFLRQTTTGEALRASQLDSWAGGWEYGEFWLLGLTLGVVSTDEQFNILCTIGNAPT